MPLIPFKYEYAGIVDPKIKFLLSFTHSQVGSNLSFFLLLSLKEDILKNFGNQTIDFYSGYNIWKSKAKPYQCSCVKQKKKAHIGLEQMESE